MKSTIEDIDYFADSILLPKYGDYIPKQFKDTIEPAWTTTDLSSIKQPRVKQVINNSSSEKEDFIHGLDEMKNF